VVGFPVRLLGGVQWCQVRGRGGDGGGADYGGSQESGSCAGAWTRVFLPTTHLYVVFLWLFFSCFFMRFLFCFCPPLVFNFRVRLAALCLSSLFLFPSSFCVWHCWHRQRGVALSCRIQQCSIEQVAGRSPRASLPCSCLSSWFGRPLLALPWLAWSRV